MKLITEEQVLNKKFRIQVIEFINSPANKARKREAKKRHEVFKDKTVKWVLEKLKEEGLKNATLKLMSNRAANVSICRKIIDKLARCYSGGVRRETGSETGNELIAQLADLLEFDMKQKKADKYRKLFRNCFSMILPELVERNGEQKIYCINKKILAPWQYDVLPLATDPEYPGLVVLSDYVERSILGLPVAGSSTSLGADSASVAARESTAQTFIFWTDKFHFTTDEKGEIIKAISPDDLLNPIEEIPGIAYHEDRDSEFWAEGGEDLVDGSILVNTLLTDVNAIAYQQGWGQLVITGKKIPQVLEGGPHSALVMTYEEGDPEPKVTVVNANPPIADWLRLIEQYVALLLSTNSLSPGNIASKLDPGQFPSGIAMLIEKSEATESVEDAQKQFAKGERREWRLVKKWHNKLLESKSLDEDFASLGPIPEDTEAAVKFLDTKEVITEKEKLENIKLRKDLGINREVELIMLDNPEMTEKEAEEKLLKIKEEQLENAVRLAKEMLENGQGNQTKQGFDNGRGPNKKTDGEP